MKIIEALKKIKHLTRKIEKTEERIRKYASFVMHENDLPVYSKTDIGKFHQQIADWCNEIARIRHAIHVTNAKVTVVYNLQTLTIDELLLLRSVVIPTRIKALQNMTRARKEIMDRQNPQIIVVMQYDPKEKDKQIDYLEEQMTIIDDILDNANLTVDIEI